MSNLDLDLLAVLQAMAKAPERRRVQEVRTKHEQQQLAQLETQIELLVDEVARVIPRTHPDFVNIVIATVLRKVAKQHEEPDYKSCLEEGVPPGY